MFFCKIAKAQDAAFSQYHASMLYLNPAFAGEERNMELSMNLRTQWKTVAVPYQTSQLSGILPLYTGSAKKNHFGGLGISLYTDKAGAGELRTIGGNVSLAKLVQLTSDDRNTLSFGVQIGGVQRKVNYDNLQWGEQYQSFHGFNSNVIPAKLSGDLNTTKLFLDIAGGAVYYYNDVQEYDNGELSGYFGVSGYHLNKPNESFSLSKSEESRLPRIFKFHGGLDIPVSSFFYVTPNALLMRQGNKNHINGGLRFIYNIHNVSNNVLLDKIRVTAGIGARINDAFIYSIGVGNKMFMLGYSYDMNAGGLGSYTNRVGASEISLILRNPVEHVFNKVDTPRI